MPLPQGDLETGKPIQPLDQSFAFSAEVRRALLTRTADQVNAYNGNFRYACIWDRLDSGAPYCIYTFDVYGFHSLAPPTENFPKCFVGFYSPAEAPVNAPWASKIAFSIPRHEMLDPWQRT